MDIAAQFESEYGRKPEFICRAPGRVNLIGEHVDYNDGPVLPAAIDREVLIAAAANPDRVVHLHALDLGSKTSFSLSDLKDKLALDGNPLPDWGLYPAGVAWSLMEAGLELKGLFASLTSNVPIGAGLSSSAAIEVGYGNAWGSVSGWRIDPLEMAQICQRAENEYVGLSCGLMDQFASACGVDNHAVYFDTRSLEFQPAPLPEEIKIVIADSGVRRSLTNSAYNERRASCEKAVELLSHYLPGIKSLRDISPIEFAAYQEYLPRIESKRAEHVVKEIARVESALSALQRQDEQAFGALMYSSHTSLRDLYEVSTPELDVLVDITRDLPGCLGARLTGAGFGGCTVNLVWEDYIREFEVSLEESYYDRTGRRAQVYSCRASQGASCRRIAD